MVLRDWNAGRIPYYSTPPALPSTSAAPLVPSVDAAAPEAGAGDAVLSSFAPEFDLAALFGEADEAALADTKSADELRGAVRLTTGEAMDDDVNGRVRLMGETSDVEDVMDDDEVAPALITRKRALEADDDDEEMEDVASTAGKKVTFALEPRSQKTKLFAENDVEAPPVPLAKKAKLAAKKEKKAARRAKSGAMAVDEEDPVSGRATSVSTSLGGLDVGGLTVEDEDVPIEDTPYDFAAYFSKTQAADDSDDEEEL